MLDPPKPGEVIRYPYLWHREHRDGEESGRKNRPCVVVYTKPDPKEPQATRVYLMPITHSPNQKDGVEILPEWREQLKRMDPNRCWIVPGEMNHFKWPGPDIRASDTANLSAGALPAAVITRLRGIVAEKVQQRRLALVDRHFDVQKAMADWRKEQASHRQPGKSLGAIAVVPER